MMRNLFRVGDKGALGFWLWSNVEIPAGAWFNIRVTPGEYSDFHFPAVSNASVLVRALDKTTIQVRFPGPLPADSSIALGAGRFVMAAHAEPFGFPAPALVTKTDAAGQTVLAGSQNFPVGLDRLRLIGMGEPVARAAQYPAIVVAYDVART